MRGGVILIAGDHQVGHFDHSYHSCCCLVSNESCHYALMTWKTSCEVEHPEILMENHSSISKNVISSI